MKKLIFLLALIASLGTVFYSACQITHRLLEDSGHTRTFSELAALTESAAKEAPRADETSDTPEMLPAYRALFALNTDLAGWLRIEGTSINHPVMHTPDDPEYYLYRDFYRSYSAHGTPFIGEGSGTACDNVIIYGHHMKGGQVFGALSAYEKASFYEAHPLISFDTLYEARTYEIVSVFKTQVYIPDAFAYYAFTQAADEAEFDAFMNECTARALYPTAAAAAFGDRLLTLSTCDYAAENNRLVIVAKQIEPFPAQ